MKTIFVSLFAVGVLALTSGCASQSTASTQDDRIGGRVGVTMPSRDMSRVVPEHADLTPPAS